MIVLHYTAGTSAESSSIFLTRPDVSASAHLVIGRKGEVFQLVPFHIEAWHAGKSWYAGRGGLNRYSIGIELDNLGKLRFSGDLFVAECGRVVSPDEVYTDCSGDHPTYWHRYTERQIRVLQEICSLLEETYRQEKLIQVRRWSSRLANCKLKTKSEKLENIPFWGRARPGCVNFMFNFNS